jgi:transcriptional regulator with XRE-family HTH domain
MMCATGSEVDYLRGNCPCSRLRYRDGMNPVGELLREWRQRRHLSQLALACDADISARHLSFIETGRAAPSRDMVLRLAERLDMPLRARNTLLTSAGFAPVYPERPLSDPALSAALTAIQHLLTAHLPFPAIAIDRHWTLVASNTAAHAMMRGVDEALMTPPINVLRMSLHPGGLASRIVNLAEWKAHVLARLRRQVDASGDTTLIAMVRELASYPVPPDGAGDPQGKAVFDVAPVFVPLILRSPAGVLSFLSTTTIFGTPVDVTLSEIALESFFPADESTAAALRRSPI